MDKKKIGTFAIIGIIIVVLIIVVSQFQTAAGPREPITGSLSEISGEVFAKLPSQADFTQILESLVLIVDSQLKTGVDGRVRIDLSDGSIIRIGPGSDFTLLGEVEDDQGFFTKLKLEAGELFVILQGGSLEVDTPQGQASVRGSYMEVTIDPDTGEIVITCLEGVCTAETEGGTVTITAGQTATITDDQLPPGVGSMSNDDVQRWLESNPEATVVILPLTATIESREDEEGTSTNTPTATNTSTATATATPTNTPTPTFTPEPPPTITMLYDYYCRSGPTDEYPQVGLLQNGTVLPIDGKFGGFWIVTHPALLKPCWVPIDAATASGNLNSVGSVSPPPVPPTPTETQPPPPTATPKPGSVIWCCDTGDTIIGSPITFYFGVDPASGQGPAPTGIVTVTGGGKSCSSTLPNTSCSITPTNPGPITYKLSYPGDSYYGASTTNFTVSAVYQTTIAVTAPTGLVYGQSATFTYSLAGAVSPTQNITVNAGGASCSGTVAAGSCTINNLNAGTYSVSATYPGDPYNAYDWASGGNMTINPATTNMSISINPPSPANGNTVTATVILSVVSPGAGSPGGTVNINMETLSCGFAGPFTNPDTLDGTLCAETYVTGGPYTVSGSYSGDANFFGSGTSMNFTVP